MSTNELKFENESNAGGTPVDLNNLEAQVMTAIDASIAGGGAPAAGTDGANDDHSLVDSILTAQVSGTGPAATAAGVAVTAAAEARTPTSGFMFQGPGKKAGASSMFIGMAATSKSTGGIFQYDSLSYGEKKELAAREKKKAPAAAAAARGRTGAQIGLVESAGVASMSLTGSSAGHTSNFIGGGTKITPQMAVQLGLVPQNLIDTLDNIVQAKNGPIQGARLEDALKKGDDTAVRQLQQHQNSAQAQSLMAKAPELMAPVMNKQ